MKHFLIQIHNLYIHIEGEINMNKLADNLTKQDLNLNTEFFVSIVLPVLFIYVSNNQQICKTSVHNTRFDIFHL